MNPLSQFSLFSAQTISPITQALLVFVSIWSLAWKGFALYTAAKREQKMWFVALLLVNTAGILEILYLFFVAKIKVDIKKLINSIPLNQKAQKPTKAKGKNLTHRNKERPITS